MKRFFELISSLFIYFRIPIACFSFIFCLHWIIELSFLLSNLSSKIWYLPLVDNILGSIFESSIILLRNIFVTYPIRIKIFLCSSIAFFLYYKILRIYATTYSKKLVGYCAILPIFYTSFFILDIQYWKIVAPILWVSFCTNTMPQSFCEKFIITPNSLHNRIFLWMNTVFIGVSDILFTRILWLNTPLARQNKKLGLLISHISKYTFLLVILPMIIAIFSFYKLPMITPSPGVQKILTNDVWKLEYDSANSRIFISGCGLEHLYSVSLDDITVIKKITSIPKTEGSQDFALNKKNHELYFLQKNTKKLCVVNSNTLVLKQISSSLPMATGDTRITFDNTHQYIFIESERDECDGESLVCVDMKNLTIRKTFDIYGILLMNQMRNELYVNSWRGKPFLYIIDTKNLRIKKKVKTKYHTELLALSNKLGRLFISSPMDSKIIVLDIDHCSIINTIPTMFGARAIGLDRTRNWLFVGSFINGEVQIIDISSNRIIKRFLVDYWLRDILVIPERREAFITGKYGLYKIKY